VSGREIPKLPEVPILNEKVSNFLSELCFVKPRDGLIDVLFVFGSSISHHELALHVISTYHGIGCRKIIITGGAASHPIQGHVNQEARSESSLIASEILENSDEIPSDNLILEEDSQNTLQNVLFGLPILHKLSPKSLGIICHSYAARRSLLTLQTYFPNVPIYVVLVGIDNWAFVSIWRISAASALWLPR
jgi:uncharacterized SAM-binding protein YcdF (DUF218 family)